MFFTNFKVLDAHLNDLEVVLKNIENATKLKTILNDIINWETATGHRKEIVANYFKSEEINNNILINSLYLSAVASFESFLVNSVQRIFEEYNNSNLSFKESNTKLIERNIEFTGKMMTTIYSPPDHVTINFFKLSTDIGTCYPDSPKVVLNTQIPYFIKKITDLDNFLAFVNGCGIQVTVDEISNLDKIKTEFKTRNTRETSNEITAYIKEVIKTRNRLAHTGQSASDISPDMFNELIRRIRLISNQITTILQAKCKFKPRKQIGN